MFKFQVAHLFIFGVDIQKGKIQKGFFFSNEIKKPSGPRDTF